MYRKIDTRFWTDVRVRSLSPHARYLMLYLVTNPHTHVGGIYYLPLSLAASETGMGERRVRTLLEELGGAALVQYDLDQHLVWVVNMLRYQARGMKIAKAVAAHLGSLHPSPLIEAFMAQYQSFDIPYQIPHAIPGTDFPCPKIIGQGQEQGQETPPNPPPPGGSRVSGSNGRPKIPTGFAAFWQTWRETGMARYKAAALKIWRDRKLEPYADKITQRLAAQIEHKRMLNERGKFAPQFQDPHRWLKNSRWNDEIGLED